MYHPFVLKDVRIFKNGKPEHHWPLDEEDGNIARDMLSKKNAFVKNPLWLKHDHQAWTSLYQNEIHENVLTAADP